LRGGVGGGVGCIDWLRLLLFPLLLFALEEFRQLMHAPCHVMLALMVSELAHLLALFVSVLGGHLLPCSVLLLLGLVPSILFVLCFLIPTVSLSLVLAFPLYNVSELFVELEMSLEGIECSQHGHNLLVVRGFGSPHPLCLEVVPLAGGKGHKGLVGHSCEFLVKPVIMVEADVLLEVVARDDKICIKQEPNRVIKGGAVVQQL
jgi:hypothetical protein